MHDRPGKVGLTVRRSGARDGQTPDRSTSLSADAGVSLERVEERVLGLRQLAPSVRQ